MMRTQERREVIGSIGRAEHFDFHTQLKTGSSDGRSADLSFPTCCLTACADKLFRGVINEKPQ